MNKLGTKLGAIAMSAVMALSFAPSAAITSLAASGDDLLDATFGVEPVYRLYNPNSGEHLFTTDVLERDSLVKENWDNEGAKWNAPSVSAEGIYRLYNPSTGEHLYTSDGLEIAHLVNDEKWEEDFGGYPAFYAADDDLDPDAITINRFFNPAGTGVSAHIFSADPAEIKALTDKGYEKENGFGGYPLDYEPEEPVEELTVSIDNPTPKVGDTLIAEVVDRNGKDVSDNVTFQWYADDKAITGSTGETLDVTIGMVGSTLKVVVTAENGNTFESKATAKVGVHTFDITSAEATKVNEITVTFADAVEAKNVTFKVTNGTTAVPIEGEPVWSITKDEAVIKTSANMATGTYTITATDAETEATDSIDFEVEKQHVDSIVILNEVALTNKDKDKAYAYYDVVDQYGESMRASSSIQWSGSCKITPDKATGKLTLTKNDGRDWVYNEQIYITGVYTKTGVAGSATLKVGTEQSLDSIEMKGFLKKGTTDIIDDLPADFKDGEYYLLFHALDQNGCPLEADEVTVDQITFVSTDVLVVKELTKFAPNAITVKGEEYNGVFVTPGIKVADGGEVTVTAIANKTGNKTELNFMVGEDPVVASFDISSPSGVIADGDTVEIPFEALDANKKPITNFRALAKQEVFNTLSFNASEGTLKLAETDSGAAKLTWTDKEMNWEDGQTTDGIDRPVSLTVVIVGGDPDNEMIYVSDKRRPNAIANVKLDDVYAEGAEFAFTLDSFQYYDQYGVLIDDDDDATDYGDDNGFFAAAAAEKLKGVDFAEYAFGVRVENAGTGYVEFDADANTAEPISQKKAVVGYSIIDPTTKTAAAYATTLNIKNAATGEGFKFDIAKFKAADDLSILDPEDWESVSPTKFKGITVVDITQVKNFTIDDLNTFYIGKINNVTGKGIIDKNALPNLNSTEPTKVATAQNMPDSHAQHVVVKGTYNGSPVTIPDAYYTISANKLKDDAEAGGVNVESGKNYLDSTIANAIVYTDLYDKTTANGTAKLGEDEVKATITKAYDRVGYWAWTAADRLHVDETLDRTQANATLENANNVKAEKVAVINEILDAREDITVDQLTGFLAEDPTDPDDPGTVAAAKTAYDNAVKARQDALDDVKEAKEADDAAQATATAKGLVLAGIVVDNTNPDDPVTLKDFADKVATDEGYDETTDPADIPGDVVTAAANAGYTVSEANIELAIDYLKAVVAAAVTQDALADATAAVPAETTVTTALNKLKRAETKEAQAAVAANAVEDEFEAASLENAAGATIYDGGVYDTAKKAITFSDQAPYAAEISGMAETYTLNPTATKIAITDITTATKKVKVLDQYGVAFAGVLEYTISNTAETKSGYAENNFKVAQNGTEATSIEGAELGDTFDLVISVRGETLKKTAKVTVGADKWASIENSTNNYTKKDGLKAVLEKQRQAGLQ